MRLSRRFLISGRENVRASMSAVLPSTCIAPTARRLDVPYFWTSGSGETTVAGCLLKGDRTDLKAFPVRPNEQCAPVVAS
jgi:hypothetical protein